MFIRQRVMWLLAAALVAGSWLAPDAARADDAESEDDESALVRGPEKRLGVGVRLRRVMLPEALLELFLADVPGGGAHTGIGAEIIRENGNFAISLGVEYEKLEPASGIWIDKGDTIPEDEPDLVEFDDFSWVGADVTFMWQQPLHSTFALRYGAGLGLAYIMGDVLRTDYACSSSETSSCTQAPNAQNNRTPEAAIPPVFPIVNVIVGAQIRPVRNLAINIEGGIRTVPFFGTTVALLF